MASIESVRASIDANVKTNGQQQITGGVLNSVLNKMVDLSEDAERALENKSAELNAGIESVRTDVKSVNDDVLSLNDRLWEIETDKADKDGKYPQLTSGFASNLVGRGESTESEFSFRASGGKSIEDGAARISELRGNGVVWNQLAKKGLSQDGIEGWCFSGNGISGLSYDSVKNEYSFPCNGPERLYTRIAFLHKHKYLVAFDIELQTTNTYSKNVYVGYLEGATQWLTDAISISEFINKRKSIATIVTANSDKSRLYLGLYQDALTSDDTQIISKPIVYDLTLMFGAGNEPTTIEEFYARMPIGVDMYAYNEGTLIPFNADAIKSVGFNAWDEQWESGTIGGDGKNAASDSQIRSKNYCDIIGGETYNLHSSSSTNAAQILLYDKDKNYLDYFSFYGNDRQLAIPQDVRYFRLRFNGEYGTTYNNDVCINLVHTGYRNGEYQPYEDFVREIDTRIKEAFPNGMKPWDKVYNKNGKGYIVKGSGEVDMGSQSWGKASEGWYQINFNMLKNDGRLISPYHAYYTNYLTAGDMSIASVSQYVVIRDSRYTDAASFKTAMAGVPLYYELAEPEVIEYDEPFNLDYEVWDFGTEEILSEQPSAPISADIIYQFNAVDTIRNNQIEIAQLKAMIAAMQAQMASMVATTIEE